MQNTTYDATTKYVFNVHFHVVYNNNGTRTNSLGVAGMPIGETEVLEAIKTLNINFNQFNIFFKYYGINKIYDTDHLILETSQEMNELDAANADPEALNIYIINGALLGGAGAAGRYFMDTFFVDPWVLCHEFGHTFSLVHPYFSNPGCQNEEHATRYSTMPEFNAATKGDQVVDTAAWGNTINNDFDNLNDCHYIGGAVDCQGTAIVPEYEVGGTYLISPTLNNFMMAPDTDLSCAPFFTPGQGIRMRQAIVGFYSNYFTSMRNTVESLYEPFVQNIIAGNTIVSVEDQPDNGGAYVCRNQLIRLRFQPGFICEFSDVVNGPITQTVNQQFNYDNSINHAIGVKIPILGNDIIKVGIVETLLCCACGFEPYISGSVISTEILGSMNLTIKELNEIQVKDPKLYDNLMEKYYYILKKQTNSGAKTEQVFYKN